MMGRTQSSGNVVFRSPIVLRKGARDVSNMRQFVKVDEFIYMIRVRVSRAQTLFGANALLTLLEFGA